MSKNKIKSTTPIAIYINIVVAKQLTQTAVLENYLWRMLNIGSGPPSFCTGDTQSTVRLFRIPFCACIENPFEFHGLFGISKNIARNTNSFPSCHAINILLIWPAIRFICNKNAKKEGQYFCVFLYHVLLFGMQWCTLSLVFFLSFTMSIFIQYVWCFRCNVLV